jgi:hypothetical protein
MGLTIGFNRNPMISVGERIGSRRNIHIISEIAINMSVVKIIISFLLEVMTLKSSSMLVTPL